VWFAGRIVQSGERRFYTPKVASSILAAPILKIIDLTKFFYFLKLRVKEDSMPAKKYKKFIKNKSKFDDWNVVFCCEYCGNKSGIKFESSRTAYAWDGEFNSINDPNRNKLLCRKCAKLHHEFWDIMWLKYQNVYLD
jgi:hypothetical protein